MNNFWIYGKHAALSALNNPERTIIEILATKEFLDSFSADYNSSKIKERLKSIKIALSSDITKRTQDPNHQGIAILVSPLSNPYITEYYNKPLITILDQLTDPHNIGAIIRSAAAFAVDLIVVPKDNSPPESSTIARSASGGLDLVPIARVTNLVDTIQKFKSQGYWIYGLDCQEGVPLQELSVSSESLRREKSVLIMGAEGKGMRSLTKKNCDFFINIPISNKIDSINVSNAAAIVFYHFYNLRNQK